MEKGTRGTRSPDLIFGVQMLPKRFKRATPAAKAEIEKKRMEVLREQILAPRQYLIFSARDEREMCA